MNTNVGTAERHPKYFASLNACLRLCAARPVLTPLLCSRCSNCFGQGGNLADLSDIF